MYNIHPPAPQDYPALQQLWQEAFGDSPAEIQVFFRTAFSPKRCLCIKPGGEIGAAAYWLDCSYKDGKLAYIYAVATATQYRHKGLCHKLFDQIHRQLLQQGYAGSILVPSEPELAPLYRSMGYEFATGIGNLVCAAKGSIPLSKLDAAAYAALRRSYLSPWDVIQEAENLCYLASFASFYAGSDFLMAGYAEDDTWIGLELLGNASHAPQIVGAMGCMRGTFQTPGKNPFAMFRPLKDSAPPGYLGFSFG